MAGDSWHLRSAAGSKLLRRNRLQALGQKAGGLLLFAVTGVVAASALDDFLMYQKCSRKAMEIAIQDGNLKQLIGDPIQQGQWYDASLAFAREGRSASCTFPVSGSSGSAKLQMRAIRIQDPGKWGGLDRFVHAGGDWEMLALEALVPPIEGRSEIQRISLARPPDKLKKATNNVVKTDCLPCQAKPVAGS